MAMFKDALTRNFYVVGGVVFFLFCMTGKGVLAQTPLPEMDRIQGLYDYHERQCFGKGWKKIVVSVLGRDRKVLWKGPAGRWDNGAIVVLHGGGGTYSNYCSNIRLGRPMVEFATLALQEGFAVFSLDSGHDLMEDEKKVPCGKRWDCLARDRQPNEDLDFIEQVIQDVIPRLRPEKSAEDIFLTGISNGGFMTILAATYFPGSITAFAPVAAGDPYGTYMNCAEGTGRTAAPGRWYDRETHSEIGKAFSCQARAYDHEETWIQHPGKKALFFKQFHHEGDRAVDISCMKKVQRLLIQHGFADAGAYIIHNKGRKNIWKHFWQKEYNKPLLEFFKNAVQNRASR